MNDETPATLSSLIATAKPDLSALSRCGLHDKTRQALEDMAFEGLSLPHAAKRHGIRTDNLQRAYDRRKVRAAYYQVVKAVRDNAAQDAYRRIDHLSRTSDSERLQFDASRWIAGVDGISPVQKVDARHQHNVQFQGFAYPDIHAKDVTPADSKSPDDDE